MSTEKPGKKTVLVTKKVDTTTKKEKIRPTTTSRSKTAIRPTKSLELLYSWSQYKVILIGVGLIGVGMLLMLGGSMPSPDVWDESIIYSFRRTVLAPGFIIAGLLVEVYAIFKD